MRRTVFDDDLYEYQFDPEPGKEYGFNLYAFMDGQSALLIDTAYGEQAAEVLADLNSRGYSLGQVIISHFHPDHVSGLKALPKVAVCAGEKYRLTLDEYPVEERDKFPLVQGLADATSMQFGSFKLTFREAPGHTLCSIYTIINDRYVHVADNLMASNDGTPVLPWAEFEQVGAHIKSLEMLKELKPKVLLLSHGKRIVGEEAIAAEIEDRLKYLRAVMEGDGEISVEEATAGCSRRFLCERWHIRREQ